mmetsp:Transcript_46691/g.69030  ORF Transcript_46691/g.69030 Transcript_46691/m.69030 type:complete len:123 (-) Transcript_46691:91-459(-)
MSSRLLDLRPMDGRTLLTKSACGDAADTVTIVVVEEMATTSEQTVAKIVRRLVEMYIPRQLTELSQILLVEEYTTSSTIDDAFSLLTAEQLLFSLCLIIIIEFIAILIQKVIKIAIFPRLRL